jgi:hypothetical protein
MVKLKMHPDLYASIDGEFSGVELRGFSKVFYEKCLQKTHNETSCIKHS